MHHCPLVDRPGLAAARRGWQCPHSDPGREPGLAPQAWATKLVSTCSEVSPVFWARRGLHCSLPTLHRIPMPDVYKAAPASGGRGTSGPRPGQDPRDRAAPPTAGVPRERVVRSISPEVPGCAGAQAFRAGFLQRQLLGRLLQTCTAPLAGGRSSDAPGVPPPTPTPRILSRNRQTTNGFTFIRSLQGYVRFRIKPSRITAQVASSQRHPQGIKVKGLHRVDPRKNLT